MRLSEIGEIVGGATPQTSNSDYYDGDVAWITPKDLSGYKYRFISKGSRNISEEGLNNCSTHILPKMSLLFTSRAPIGYIAIANNDICTNQGFKSIIPNKSIVDPLFLYYKIQSETGSIKELGTGTIFPEVSGKVFGNHIITIPPISSQKKIASILSSLDDMIENNMKINDYLAQISEVMFDEEYIKTFNSVLISDLVDVCYGKDHKKLNEGTIPTYGSGGIMRYVERSLYSGDESVLIPRKGTLNNVKYTSEPFWCVDTMFYTKMKRRNITKYVYHFLKKQDLSSMNAGSTIPSMTTEILNSMKINIPNESQMKKLDKALQPLYDLMLTVEKQNNVLSIIRKIILPKLMSGDIDISKLESDS